MERVENESKVNGPPMPMAMEVETTDNSLLLEEKATHAQEDADKILCHKCGAWIIAKNAQGSSARLTLWGHPAECGLFGISCKAFSTNDCGEETDHAANNTAPPQGSSPNNYEEETDCAANNFHHNSKYTASKVPKKLMA